MYKVKNTLTAFAVVLSVLMLAYTAAANSVSVGNIEELYAAVNDPGNAGATIVLILGGLSSNATPANGNTVNFEAHGDHFTENTGFTTLDFGGLVVLGGENISIPNGTNNNTVNVQLWGCRSSGNNTYDLVGVGARSTPAAIGSPGINNHVTIEIHGEGSGKADGGRSISSPAAFRTIRWKPTLIR